LKIGLLTDSYAQAILPIPGMDRLQDFLYRLVPFDPGKGEEGVTAQGVILIGLLILISFAAWKGLENILEGFNRWTWAALGLVALTLLVAALRITPGITPGISPIAGGLEIGFTGRFFGVLLALLVLGYLARYRLVGREVQEWLWESWRFVKQIFPLLVAGVFAVGVIRQLIRPEWIETLAGENTLLGNLAGVAFGVFMYFPTLVEVPIARMFLSLGMHRGPLLAYLMADPELSLQSILIVSAIIGRLKAWTYVAWVALFSTLAGLIYGSWVDGTSLGLIALFLAAFLAILGLGLWWVNRWSQMAPALADSISRD
ncbi:MAG TPA: permease, partial [Anaerolineales bacterium]|nr:permease [Anaerolineales bacterium]